MTRSRHRLSSLLVLPLAVAALAVPAIAKDKPADPAAAPAAKFNLSRPVQNALAAAQAAIGAKDYTTAAAKLAEADAALQTDDDRYVAGRMHIQLAQATNNTADEAKYLAQLVDSPKLTSDERIHFLNAQAQIADQAKDYPTEQAALAKLAQLAPNDPNTFLTMADAAQAQKDYAGALTDTEKAAAIYGQTNQPLPPAVAHNLYAFAFNSHNQAALAKYGPMLIASSPTPENWMLVINSARDTMHLDDQGRLDLFRLLRVTNTLTDPGDLTDYADLASRHGLPGEAMAVLDLGQQQGAKLNAGDVAEIRSSSASKVAADRASLPGLEAAARAAPTGRKAEGLADGYLEYGEDAKAAEFYGLALQKGGDVDVATAQTRLGIALARSGQKDGAKAAFAKVSGPRQPLANLWILWVDHHA